MGWQYMSNRTPSSASYKTDQLQARAHTNTQADMVGYTLDTAFTYDMCRQVFSCTLMHLISIMVSPGFSVIFAAWLQVIPAL